MRLRKPCEHDRYEKHWIGAPAENSGALCPGGEFLPEDAIVIEKLENGEWPEWVREKVYEFNQGFKAMTSGRFIAPLVAFLDALAADQVGEPE